MISTLPRAAMNVRRVFLASPFAATTEAQLRVHIAYARQCFRDCVELGEAPFAPHLLYPQPGLLSDHRSLERSRGIVCGLAWMRQADALVAFRDFGISEGMGEEIAAAHFYRVPVIFRESAAAVAAAREAELHGGDPWRPGAPCSLSAFEPGEPIDLPAAGTTGGEG